MHRHSGYMAAKNPLQKNLKSLFSLLWFWKRRSTWFPHSCKTRAHSTLFWTCSAFLLDPLRGKASKAPRMKRPVNCRTVNSEQNMGWMVSQIHVCNLHEYFIIYNKLSIIFPNTQFCHQKKFRLQDCVNSLFVYLSVLQAYSGSSPKVVECCSEFIAHWRLTDYSRDTSVHPGLCCAMHHAVLLYARCSSSTNSSPFCKTLTCKSNKNWVAASSSFILHHLLYVTIKSKKEITKLNSLVQKVPFFTPTVLCLPADGKIGKHQL